MAEKLTVQQLSTLNTYLKKHPDAKREDAIKLLFDGSNTKQTEKGVKVEHNKSDKKQTITLKSGLSVDVAKGTTVETKEGKITLSKTGRYSVTGKDGKTKYYAANGKELNEKYFKQVESSTGNVMVKNSKGVTVDVNKRLQNRIARASKELKHEEDNQGWMGKLWSGTKNTFGFGDSSDKVKEQLKQEQKLLKQFNQQPQNRAKIFKQLTSLEYNTKNMQDFVEGKIQLQSEKNLDGYKEGQKIAVDVASDVVSGVASFGVYTAAVAAAPFTAGASIAVGVAAAGVVGAGVKAGLKASDTIGTDKKYDSLGSDLLMGSVNGAIAPLTAGAGGAVAKTVAVRAGVQVVKETGKQATKQVISQTTKNAAKQGFARTFKTNLAESIVQPNNYKLVGGTLTKRLGAYASEGAVDGALSGGAYSGVETAKNGGNTGEILQATALGFGMGAFMGGAMTSLAHSKGIVTGNKNATKTTDKYPQLTEIDKIARHDEINQANLSPHRFSDVSGKKAQKQVSDYLDHLLSIIPENTPEANNVNKVKKYADFILPDGTLISRNHAGDTGIPVMNPTTGQWEIPDVENAVLFWIKDVEGKEHVLPALTPENVSKAKRIIEYMSSQTEIPRENINTVQKEFLNKIKPNPKEITQDAVETSVVKETDNTVPTPKAQGDSSLAPSGRGLGRGADDITPTPKPQGANSEINIPQGKFAAPNAKFVETDEAFRTIVTKRKSDIQELDKIADIDEFCEKSFKLMKEEMGLEDSDIKLKITDKDNYYDHETNTVYISRNWSGKEKGHVSGKGDKAEIFGGMAHELNHYLQWKEIVLNFDSENPNWNNIISYLQQFEGAQKNIEYLIGKYPDNTELKAAFDKARSYQDNWLNYVDAFDENGKLKTGAEYDKYRNQTVEAESFRRGDIMAEEYRNITNEKKPYTKPEMQTKSLELADDLMASPPSTVKTTMSDEINIISKDSTIASDKEIMNLLQNSKPPIHRSFHSREEWLEFKDIIKDYSSSAENIINEYITPIMRGSHTNWTNVNKILKNSIDTDGNLNLSNVKNQFDKILNEVKIKEQKRQELKILIKEKTNIEEPEVIGHIASMAMNTADGEINTEVIDLVAKLDKKGLKEYNYEIVLDYLTDFETNHKIDSQKLKAFNMLADTDIDLDNLKYIYSKISRFYNPQKTYDAAEKILKLFTDNPIRFEQVLDKNSEIFYSISDETLDATEYFIKNNIDKKILENLSYYSRCKENTPEFDELLTKIAQRDLIKYKNSPHKVCDMAKIPDNVYDKFIERNLEDSNFILGDKIKLAQLKDKDWKSIQDKKLLSNHACKTANDVIDLMDLTQKEWDLLKSKNLFNNSYLDGSHIAKMAKFTENQWIFIDKNNILKDNLISNTLIEFISDMGNSVNKTSVSQLSKQEKRNLLMTILKNKSLLTEKNRVDKYPGLDLIPLLPTDENSYAKTMRQVSQSLNISFDTLPQPKIEEFNNAMTNLQKTLKSINLSDLSEVNLTKSHEDFIRKTQSIIENLSPVEQAKVQDYFGFKIENNRLIGYPNSKNINIETFGITDTNSQKIIENLRKVVEDYSDNNFITTKDNPILNQQLKELSKSVPEIFNQIDGSKDPVEMIKALQKIVKNPNFDKLSETDKRVLTLATLLHKTDKLSNNSAESAFDAYFIAKKFNLSKVDAQKVYTIIENSDAIEKFMSTSKKETVKNYYVGSVIGQERSNMLDLLAFKLKESNLFELTQMLYSAKQPDGLTRHFDTLLSNRIKEIKSYDFVLPQTTKETIMSKATVQNINGYNVNVANASDIENFYALIHTPEAGYTTGGTRSANFANFDAFETLNDNKVICTSYISDSKAALAHEFHHGFVFDVANDKQYVGFRRDIYSLSKNVEDMLVEYFGNGSYKSHVASTHDKIGERMHISSYLKGYLYGDNISVKTNKMNYQLDSVTKKYDIQIKNLNKQRIEMLKKMAGTDNITTEQYKQLRYDSEILKIEQKIKQLEQDKVNAIKLVKNSYPEIDEINNKYIKKLDEIKEKLGSRTMTIENLEQIDPEFAQAYKKLLEGNGLLSSFRHNEVLISNPKISAIYTDDINKLPEEYLIKAQEENLPIVIIK